MTGNYAAGGNGYLQLKGADSSPRACGKPVSR